MGLPVHLSLFDAMDKKETAYLNLRIQHCNENAFKTISLTKVNDILDKSSNIMNKDFRLLLA